MAGEVKPLGKDAAKIEVSTPEERSSTFFLANAADPEAPIPLSLSLKAKLDDAASPGDVLGGPGRDIASALEAV